MTSIAAAEALRSHPEEERVRPVTHRWAQRRRRAVGAVAAAAVVISACTTAPGAGAHGPAGSPARPRLDHAPVDEITVGTVSGLGQVLVDGTGLTVYTFTADHRGHPSVCVSLCAAAWPALVLPTGVAAPIAGPGIRVKLLGTATRSDGRVQITYDGWPLYTWPPDTAPGQATGQALTNLGGRWYVIRADGTIVHTP